MGTSSSTQYAPVLNPVMFNPVKPRPGILTECTVWHVLAACIGSVVLCLSVWTVGFEVAIDIPSLMYLYIAFASFLVVATLRIAYLKISGGPKDPSNNMPIYHHTQFDRALVAMGILTMATMYSTMRLAYFYINFKSYLHLTDEVIAVNPASNFNLILWMNLHAALDPFVLTFFVYLILFAWMLNDETNPRFANKT